METIQMLGSLGEFVGAIAVVATLVYLAIQVRHSKEAMEANTKSLDENRQLAIAQSYQSRTQMVHEFFLRQADSDELAHIRTKWGDGSATLTPEEAIRMQGLYGAGLSRLDNMHFQHQLGYLTDEFYESAFKNVVKMFTWNEHDLNVQLEMQRPSFRDEITRILAESEENEQ